MEKIYGEHLWYFLLASKTRQLPIPVSKAIGILGSAYSEGLLIIFQHRCCRDDSKPIPNMFLQDRVRRNNEKTDI